MGQSESSTATGGKGGASARRSSSDNNNKARYQLRSTSKAPAKVIINKPKVQEGKAILRVPHTNVKIMHVDPTERAGIVPTHGYIALQIVPPEEREAAEAAGMDPLQMISPTAGGGGSSTRAKAKRARNGGGKKNNGGSAATTPRNRRGFGDNESGITSGDDGVTSEMSQQVGDEVVDAGMDPEYAAMLNRARQEYSADTHRNVTREVKKWKAAFSLENGRAPNKKDIAGNPFIYQQYYMEKELEAMKKLLDENERAEAEAQREAAWLEQNRAMQTQQNNLVRDLTDLEVARSEYNAMEFVDLQREVKKWKSDFKKLQNRPPTKKDVADSPEIYDKYYRLKDLEAMKKLMDDADAMERSVLAKNNMRGGGNTGGGGGSFRGEIGSINSGSVDPIEYAKAQFDSSEYASLQHEVRQWKVAFKSARGRPPTKRDISEDPEIFAKYYREKELEAMKKLIEDTEATMRRASVIDGFETLERAKQEYNAEEHERLQGDVKAWKLAFKNTFGRPPTKKDISQDADMFPKYYREKELDAMKKLAQEEEEFMANGGTSQQFSTQVLSGSSSQLVGGRRRSSGRAGGTGRRRLSSAVQVTIAANAIAAAGAAAGSSSSHGPETKRHRVEGTMNSMSVLSAGSPLSIDTPHSGDKSATNNEDGSPSTVMTAATPLPHREPGEMLSFTATDTTAALASGLATNDDEESAAAARFTKPTETTIIAASSMSASPLPLPQYMNKAPMPLGGFEEQLPDAAEASSSTVVRTQYVCPRGHQAAERVYFFDAALQLDERGAALTGMAIHGLYDPVAEANRYEVEEGEIYEMAGIRRPQPSNLDEDADPLATYELQSNVLEALRMAIDAPMSDFAGNTQETAYDGALNAFIAEALNEAHELFDEERDKDAAYQKTYSVANMAHTKSSRAGMGRKLMSKMKSRVQSSVKLRAMTIDDGDGDHVGAAAADPAAEDDDYAGWSRDDLVRERKKLHKMLNEYKNRHIESTGRAPEAFEMAQDPEIRDTFAQYHELKKRTKQTMEAVVEAAMLQGGGMTENDMSEASPERHYEQHNNTVEEEQHHQEDDGRKGFNPFARVLETMNEDAARKQRLLAPLAGSEQQVEVEMSPEERELDILSKEVKIWKRGFKEREGRNPTRRDIKSDPEFAEKYFRVKELEALLGKSGDGAADGDDEEATSTTKKKKKKSRKHRNETDEDDGGVTSHGEELASPPRDEHATTTTTTSERRGFPLTHLDENQLDAGMVPPVGYQLRHDDDEELDHTTTRGGGQFDLSTEEGFDAASAHLSGEEHINRRDVEADEDIELRMILSNAMAMGLPVTMPSAVATSPTAAAHINAPPPEEEEEDEESLAKSIADYRAFGGDEVPESNNRDSIPINSTPAPAPVQQGWSFPMDDAVAANERNNNHNDEDNEEEKEPEMTAEEMKERRKALAKELNQWKAHFKMVNNKAPTAKDIKQHPPIQKIFDEYQALSKDIDAKDAQKKARTVVAFTTVSPSPGRQQQGSRANSPAVDEDGAPLTPLSAAKHRRKHLAREIADWRAQYKVQEGHPPTLRDIAASEHIAEVYEEYTKLNDFVSQREGGGGANGPEDVNETVALALRRKNLARSLNEWKAKFHDTYGRNPGVRDIKTDKHAALMFEEYNLIPKNVEDDAAQQLERVEHAEANDEATQLKETKIRKKELNKILNEWKSQFAESMGRKPKVADILADPVVSAVYSEFQELQAALADAQSGATTQQAPQQQAADGFAPWAADPNAPSQWGEDQNQQQHQQQEEVDDANRPPTPLAKRKKRVTKQLNQWKSDYAAANNGRNPTKADIKKDPEAFALFQQYQQLKDELAAEGGGKEGEDEEADNGGGNTTTEQSPQRLPAAAAEEEDGVNPEEAAAAETPAHEDPDTTNPDHHVAAAESPQPTHPDVPPTTTGRGDESEPPVADPAVEVESEVDRLKSTKKALNKRLNAWKQSFTENTGRAPKAADIQQDNEMLALYEELKGIKLQLKKLDAGGGGGDD